MFQRQLEILDLRHFSASALRPLLQEQAAVWERRLLWDYRRSIELLLEYIDNRSLTGYVALHGGNVAGYAFGVCEANKAVVGDVYAFGESERRDTPISNVLLENLLDTLQATPGIERVESQLLLFPDGALHSPFVSRGLRPFPRRFMTVALDAALPGRAAGTTSPVQPERWHAECYTAAAALIHDAYTGHMDSQINDQYQTLTGAQRFLHNIVHFPGCGIFDAAHSWLLRDPQTRALEGLILCSRVRRDAAHITQLCVRPALRGRGLGESLLSHCLAQLRDDGITTASLTVTEKNDGARRLYERQGFQSRHRFEAWVWEKSEK